ncbi:MAG: YdeI/OmpD-associated family protein [Sedimentisphaerales bacterium]
MKKLYFAHRNQWREWLSQNHDGETAVLLIFYRKETSKPTISYDAAVEEALCFGWIDGIIKKIDAVTYARKFTPRKPDSKWSALNKKRAVQMIKEGKMTGHGLAKIQAAKKTGLFNQDPRPQIPIDLPAEFASALGRNKKAKENFEKLAPSYRRHYIGWIAIAKRPETKKQRINESITLLEKGEKLGLR